MTVGPRTAPIPDAPQETHHPQVSRPTYVTMRRATLPAEAHLEQDLLLTPAARATLGLPRRLRRRSEG